MLHAGHRDTAVLICPPWGFEALCAHKSLRILADQLADRGYAVLRFDYPGTGDSAVDPEAVGDVDAWRTAVVEAAEDLTRLSGASRIVLCGLGLGALLARLASPDVPALGGFILLGPVSDGRRHLREISAWSAMINDKIGLPPEAAATGGVGIAGFRMPDALATSIKALRAAALPMPQVRHFVAMRPGQTVDADFTAALKGADIACEAIAFEGYDLLTGDPTSARTPAEVWNAVGAWMDANFPAEDASCPPMPAPLAAQVGAAFEEEALRFGPGDHLFGILCRPAGASGASGGKVFVFLNSGFDPHLGWARSTVDNARGLAKAGIASLRFDAADVGDSPALPDSPRQVLYSEAQARDVTSAIDMLEARGFSDVILAGRCSGAFLGLAGAVRDPRVKGAVLVNILRFIWNPEEDVDEAIRNSFRSLANYRSRMLELKTFKRLFTGDIDVVRVSADVFRRMSQKLGVRLAPVSFGMTKYARLYDEVHRRFRLLRERGTRISLVYSADDGGLDELSTYFRAGGAGLAAYPNTTLTIVPDADHNMTPRAAREALLAHLIDFASKG
ncbi:alpha/beta fold hydrolase [Hartmannibacter diazotrophicus]|nr:alpha/beta fold hydrolase [Hartmannibacter diazotrophicus]